jgi:hypothetical protein
MFRDLAAEVATAVSIVAFVLMVLLYAGLLIPPVFP